jgi:hemerythrin-like metal-binding protein
MSVAASSTAQALEFFMFDARQSAMDQTLWWDQSFSVSIAELDHQHQRLFRTVAELNYAVRTGRGDSIINEVLEKVIQHTISHFAAEELLLQQHGYPGLAAHRYEHQMLAQKLTKFHLSNIAGKPDIPSSLLVFLQTWLRDHILKTDKEYSAFLNARGVF